MDAPPISRGGTFPWMHHPPLEVIQAEKKVGISCFCPQFVSSIQEASICQSQIAAWSAVKKSWNHCFDEMLVEIHSSHSTPCVYPSWGIHCVIGGYSRWFSRGIRGYSGVFSRYSHPGAFQNHWFFHISALDLFGPSDSYIILKGKIKHFSHKENNFSYKGEFGTLRSHQPGLFA